MRWSFAVTDRQGTVAAVLDPRGAALTVRLNGPAELVGAADARRAEGRELEPAATAVRAYRAGVLRFNGQVTEPLERSLTEVKFKAADPLAFLAFRRRATSRTFAATDGATIANDLLSDENVREPTLLAVDAAPPTTVDRDREYAAGKQILEALGELASADSGFYFRALPVGDDTTVLARLDMSYPASGTDKKGAIFYLVGNGGNIGPDFTETLGLPVVHVVATGAQKDDGTQATGSASDATAQTAYGLVEEWLAYTDVSDTGLLGDLATDALETVPPRTYKFTPVPGGPGVRVPALWDDFDVGDRVAIRVKVNAIDVDTLARVTEATVTISDDANVEQLTSLVLET